MGGSTKSSIDRGKLLTLSSFVSDNYFFAFPFPGRPDLSGSREGNLSPLVDNNVSVSPSLCFLHFVLATIFTNVFMKKNAFLVHCLLSDPMSTKVLFSLKVDFLSFKFSWALHLSSCFAFFPS